MALETGHTADFVAAVGAAQRDSFVTARLESAAPTTGVGRRAGSPVTAASCAWSGTPRRVAAAVEAAWAGRRHAQER